MWAGALGVLLFLVSRGSSTRPSSEPARRAAGAPVLGPDDREPASRELGARELFEEAPPSSYRLDRRHTGRSPFRGPSEANLRWSQEAGPRIVGQPVVGADGRVFVGVAGRRQDGDRWRPHGELVCFAADGRELWRRDLRGPVWSTPLIDASGRIYVGSDAGLFFALDPDGSTRWSVETGRAADAGSSFGPDGAIHFAAGDEVWKVSPEGEVLWRFAAREKVFAAPAIDDDGTVFVGSQDDHLYALSSEGRMRWAYRTAGDNDSSPAIGEDGTIYFGSDDHHVYALSQDGELRWSIDLEGYVRAPVALSSKGAVLASVFGPRPRIVAIDALTGRAIWSFRLSVTASEDAGSRSGPLVDREGSIYVGGHDRFVYGLSAEGVLRWSFETGGEVDSTPSLAPDGTLLIGADDGRVYAFR